VHGNSHWNNFASSYYLVMQQLPPRRTETCPSSWLMRVVLQSLKV
jgi:hypothetical protein